MKDQNGFTLPEIVVVIALIVGALAIATSNLTQMNQKYLVESNIKEIHSIITTARNDATRTNATRLVVLGANTVQTGPDLDNNNIIDGAPTPRNFSPFAININGAGPISFNRRGLPNLGRTISIAGYPANVNPAIDCIALAPTRINLGRMTGGACVPR
jgi:prepilin-type N-terminal cleavage/methylation domain-containing protein